MTATIIESDVDTDITNLLDWKHSPVCEAEYDDGSNCDQPAKFVCVLSCCGSTILLCEDCFFHFIEFCKNYEGVRYSCSMCDARLTLTSDHLRVIGRI